jgi:hypothetical protein
MRRAFLFLACGSLGAFLSKVLPFVSFLAKGFDIMEKNVD